MPPRGGNRDSETYPAGRGYDLCICVHAEQNAVPAQALDPAVGRRSGQTLAVGDLARSYGFTDLDGRQPTPYSIVP
ncbi:MAG: hypothetical protein WBR23_09770 [Candidatus Dormiibacterota bacterium]